MINFYKLHEILSSHGGLYFSPKPSEEEKSILPREDLDKDEKILTKSIRFESLLFGAVDKKYIDKMYAVDNKKGIIAGLDRMLSKIEDFDFHVFIGKPFFFGTYKDEKTNEIKNYKQEIPHTSILQKYFFETLKIPSNDIVFNKQSSSGDVLTPWMILHTLAHAISLYVKFNKDITNQIYDFFEKIKNYPKEENYNKKNLDFIISEPHRDSSSEILPLLFNFKSVRTINPPNVPVEKLKMARVADMEELIHELFVYYLINGLKIPMPSQENIYKILKYTTHNDIEHLTLDIQNLFNLIKSYFYQTLRKCQGRVLVD